MSETPSTTFIYGLIDPRTNELRYVGKANDPKKRFYRHMELAKEKKTHKDCWISGVMRDGFSPILTILEEVPFSEWEEKEKEHIAKHKNLVNICTGGIGKDVTTDEEIYNLRKKNDTIWTEEVRGNLRDFFKDKKRGPCSEETKDKIGKEHNKKVYQYDDNGVLVKVWDSVKSVCAFYKTDTIRRMINLCRPKAYDFWWSYGEMPKIEKREGRWSLKKVTIYQFNEDLELVGTWESLTSAAKSVSANSGLFHSVVQNKQKYKGFYWSKTPVFEKEVRCYNGIKKPLLQFDVDHNFIQEWDSLTNAAKAIDRSCSTLGGALKTTKFCGGYFWEYK